MNAMSNMPIRIEANIPIPTSAGNSKYPFSSMSVGDSFYAEINPVKLRGSVEYFRKSNPSFKATIRAERQGARCWRIA